jgi:hypothetical protein
MPVEGMPDPTVHRICRRCGKWFDPAEGRLMAPEATGPMGMMHAARASFDGSMLRFQCDRCTRIRRNTERALWATLLALMGLVLLLEQLGWL